MKLALPNTSRRNKELTEAWIRQQVVKDQIKGRHSKDFTTKGLAQAVQAMASYMKSQGFDTYQGSGNIFYAKQAANNDVFVIQARPLAQRTVRLKFA